ncbi:hypothetical protein ATC03_12085 [Agromyces aureus]|uniref:Uncharacterized protein n=1 Tax=Agromyces aureus TaxID=453304 RepID=A0A191WGJ3_9MICO|nr:hypothetical protein ATC03_12085 [Agromyces aureus]
MDMTTRQTVETSQFHIQGFSEHAEVDLRFRREEFGCPTPKPLILLPILLHEFGSATFKLGKSLSIERVIVWQRTGRNQLVSKTTRKYVAMLDVAHWKRGMIAGGIPVIGDDSGDDEDLLERP